MYLSISKTKFFDPIFKKLIQSIVIHGKKSIDLKPSISKVYELLIQLTDFGLENVTAHYNAFAVGTEAEGYDLRLLGQYDGDAGDSLSYHASMKFSTHDMDQDQWPDGNCARDHTGGWWYRGCDSRSSLLTFSFAFFACITTYSIEILQHFSRSFHNFQ